MNAAAGKERSHETGSPRVLTGQATRPALQPIVGASAEVVSPQREFVAYGDSVPALRPDIATTSRRKPKSSWVLMALVFLLAASVTFAWAYLAAQSWLARGVAHAFAQPSEGNSDLGMQVDSQGDSLRVSWNHIPDLDFSKRGVLQIVDGTQRREVQLDPVQLANGSILYKPATDDVTFHLEIRSDGTSPVSQTLRMLDGSRLGTGTWTEPRPIPPAPSPAKPAEAPVAKPSALPAVMVSVVLNRPRANAPAGYIAAKPLKPVVPKANLPEHSSLAQSFEVDVQITIDKAGRVTRTRLMRTRPSRNTPINSALTKTSLSAAGQWTFEPAKASGKAVFSRRTITFHFAPHAPQS